MKDRFRFPIGFILLTIIVNIEAHAHSKQAQTSVQTLA